MLEKATKLTFVEQVNEYIKNKGLRETTVYKAAQMDRRLFSKVMSDRTYKPSKDTALAMAYSLHLTLEEAEDLLDRAGYSLSNSDKRDIVMGFFGSSVGFLHSNGIVGIGISLIIVAVAALNFILDFKNIYFDCVIFNLHIYFGNRINTK